MLYKILILYLVSEVYGIDIFLDSQKTVFTANEHEALFGYSLLLHGSEGVRQSSNEMCVLRVGAPKAFNTNGIQTGVIFQCYTQNLPLNGHVNCTEDQLKTDVYRRIGRNLINREDIWYGASIAAITPDSYVACAPRLTQLYGSRNPTHMLMYGACVVKSRGTYTNLTPFSNQHSLAFTVDDSRKDYKANATFFYYAFAEAGMSLTVANKNRIIIGAPGVLQWTGGVAEYTSSCDKFGCRNINQRTFMNPFYINEVKQDDYLGYSVESGIFDNSGTTLYVAGAPRSAAGYGQVLIYDPATFKVRKVLVGPHLGSYFGATLLCADVNGDNVLDVLVGAPNFVSTEDHMVFDQGAVFVYLNFNLSQGDFFLDKRNYVTGSGASGARFGSAMANIGDINGDGYNDIAIGAPWANNGESGVVYIYRGSKYGLESKFTQKITAEGSKSFGFSISNAYDVDSNNCNDFAVGAPNSNKVYLYKCIPSIVVNAKIDIENILDLPRNATNFTARFRVSSPSHRNNVKVKLHLRAKITVNSYNNEATLFGDSEYAIVLKAEDYHIHEQIIQVKPTANLSMPITIHFKVEENSELASKDPQQFGRVSEYSELYSTNDVKLMRDCGSDLKCTPLLKLDITPCVSKYIPGTGQKLGVNITVVNLEEPAYDAKVHISLPLLPIRVPSGCSLELEQMICNVLSPLNRMEKDTWELEFEFDNYPFNFERKLIINASLEQINIDEKIYKECVIRIVPQFNLSIIGKVLPNISIPVTREDLNNNANISFTHTFEIKNSGPSHYYNLLGIISHPDMVISHYLTNNSIYDDIENVFENETRFREFDIPANGTCAVTTKYILDLGKFGTYLNEHMNLNFSSKIQLLHEPVYNMNAIVTTTLILEPASPLWPLIVGVIGGLAVLAVIIFVFNKFGFFSRPNHENLKKLKMEETAAKENEPGCSNVLALDEYESSQLLCVSDTDDDKENDND